MIPLREQEIIRQRFAQELTSRVRIDYFTQRQTRLIIPGRQDCVHCEDVRTILEELAHLSSRIALSVHELSDEAKLAAELGVDKVPGTVIRGQANRPVRYAGIPMGAQFPVFLDAVIEAAKQSPELKPETARQLKKLKQDIAVQVFVTPTCAHSVGTARAALRFGLLSPRVKVEVIEITEFPPLAERLGIQATPTTLLDGRLLIPGAMDEALLLKAVFRAVEGKPIAPGDIQPGPATRFQPPQPQSERQPATTASGIILPR